MNNIQMYGITNSTVNFKANGSKMVTKASEKAAETLKELAAPVAGTLAAMVGIKTVSDSKKTTKEDEIIAKVRQQANEKIDKAYNEFSNLADNAAELYDQGFENLKNYGVVEKLDNGALQIVGKTDSLNYKFISERDNHRLLSEIEVHDKDGNFIQRIDFFSNNKQMPCRVVDVVTNEGHAKFVVYDDELELIEWHQAFSNRRPEEVVGLAKYIGEDFRVDIGNGKTFYVKL